MRSKIKLLEVDNKNKIFLYFSNGIDDNFILILDFVDQSVRFMVPFTIIRIGHVLFFGLSVDVELHPHAPNLQSQRYLAPSLLWMEFAVSL